MVYRAACFEGDDVYAAIHQSRVSRRDRRNGRLGTVADLKCVRALMACCSRGADYGPAVPAAAEWDCGVTCALPLPPACGGLQGVLNRLSKEGKWTEMGELIEDVHLSLQIEERL